MMLTTFKSLNHKFALASVTLLTASALGGAFMGGSTTANAADTQNQVSNGSVTIYAQQAAPTGANQLGPNDGTSLTSGPTMANVTFSATQITPANGGTVSSMKPTDSTTYTTVGSALSETTNSNGVADFSGLTDGYWLFQQVTTVGGIKTVDNFIVSVNTVDSLAGNVNVYPKLDMSQSSGLFDVATTNADDNYNGKTPNQIAAPNANGQADTNPLDKSNTTTAGAGNTVTWNVNTIFDQSQVSNNSAGTSPTAGTYIITDVLPSGVTAGNTNSVVVNDGIQDLTYGTDYTVSINGQTVTVTLTAAGQEKVEKDLPTTVDVSGNINLNLNIQIPSTVNNNAVGTYSDSATTTITNAYGIDLSTTTPASSTLNVGGLDFTKEDESSQAVLADATFVLVKAADKAAAQALVEANSSYFNNNASTVATNPLIMSNSTAAFVTDSTGKVVSTTTNASGVGMFTGLNLVDDNTDTSNTTNYFAVEVVAPTDYQFPTASNGANVFGSELTNTTPQATNNTITNISTKQQLFALPFTGGAGIAAIMIIAASAGFAAFVIRRRKDAEEEIHDVK